MSPDVRTVLVTGASGVVGRAVAEALPDAHVVGLVHADAHVPEVDEVVHGDVSRPRFGLDAAAWAELARRVDAVVHSAALTEWGLPDERYVPVNVDGARHATELAVLGDAHLHLVSTCFVRALAQDGPGLLREDNVVRPYVASKRRAEAIVRESGAAWSISRPTNLVGHHRTGVSSRPQIVQTLSDWLLRGRAPFFPAHDGNRVDVVPVDVLAEVVAYATTGAAPGAEWWVTCGERAMTVEDTVVELAAHAAERGRTWTPPPAADPRRPLPVALDDVPPLTRRFLRVLMDVSESTWISGGVLPTSLPELAGPAGLSDFDDRAAYRASLAHWAGAGRAATTAGAR